MNRSARYSRYAGVSVRDSRGQVLAGGFLSATLATFDRSLPVPLAYRAPLRGDLPVSLHRPLRGTPRCAPWPRQANADRSPHVRDGLLRRRIARAASAVLLVLLTASPAPGGEADAEALLRRVSRKYAAVRSLSAEFRQEVPLQNVGIVRKAAGRLYFEKPLKMRWDYRAPDTQLFLSDGEHFYFRPPDSAQVFRRRIDERSLGGKVPLLLLFGNGEISEFFAARDAVVRKGGEEIALRLVPRGEAESEVRRVDLVIGAEDGVIREVHLYDRLGGSNHLFLQGTAIDPDLPPGLFRFRETPGIEVVDE